MIPTEDLLSQLRDIHEPIAPSFWPLAPAWWILLVLCALGLVVAAYWAVQFLRRLQPYLRVRHLARTLTEQRESGRIDALQYASSINLLYKEVIIKIENRTDAIPLFGPTWLNLLAQRFSESRFNTAEGQCLGNHLYCPSHQFRDDGLTTLVNETLVRVHPRSTPNA